MKKLFSLFVALIATCALRAGNVITYMATEKLPEVNETYDYGLHTNAFNVSITNHTFGDGIGTITFAGEVTSIGTRAFYDCEGLTSITIPNSVTSIGESAFERCSSLTSINIPNSVTSMGESVFKSCKSLTSITIPNTVKRVDTEAFSCCSSLTSVYIPNSVTHIESEAFFGCHSLTSINIPNSVTWIAKSAFNSCSSLTSITIPYSVTRIEKYAFSGCNGLTSIMVESGNANYDSRDNCNAIIESASNTLIVGCKNTIIPNTVTRIGEQAFSACFDLTSITIPNAVTSIESRAFYRCTGLTYITLGNSLTGIGSEVLFGCEGLTSITIPNSVTWIGKSAFRACRGLTSITIPNSVKSIGDYAFDACSGLKSVTIGNSVTSIGTRAFDDCSNLESVTIGPSVTSIGKYAFSGCPSVTSITCEATTPPVCYEYPFYGVPDSIPVYVPCGSIEAYHQAGGWKEFTNIKCIAADQVEEITEVEVEPTDQSATITWPASEDAMTYTLVIAQDGETVCTRTFNSNGQLTSLAFAPSRNGEHVPARAAQAVTGGWQFTITGLNPSTNYTYTVTTKDAEDNVVAEYAGSFSTTEFMATAIEETTVNKYVNTATKLLRDGQLLIQRDCKTYNMQGAQVE